MVITFFGILWLIILFIAFFRNDANWIVFLTILSTVFQCNNVIIINNIGVGPMVISSFVMIFWCLIRNKKKFLFDKTKVYGLLIILFIIISLNYNGEELLKEKIFFVIQLYIYISCFNCLRKTSLTNEIKLNAIIKNTIYVVMFVGIIQYLITSNIFPWLSDVYSLFFNNEINSTSSAFYQYLSGTTYRRVFSTYMEPSYCAPFLVGSFYYICVNYDEFKYPLITMIVLLIEILLTMSSTAFGTLAIVGIIFAFTTNRKKLLKILIPLGIITLVFTLPTGILDRVIFSKSTTGSYQVRADMDANAIRFFESSPYIGIGYKIKRASSLIPSILSQIGVLGLISFCLFIFGYIKDMFNKQNSSIYLGCLYFFAASLVSQLIGIPDIDFCVLWFSFYILALNFKNKNDKKRDRRLLYETI